MKRFRPSHRPCYRAVVQKLLLILLLALPALAETLPPGTFAVFGKNMPDGQYRLRLYRWEQPTSGDGRFELQMTALTEKRPWVHAVMSDGSGTAVFARDSQFQNRLEFRVSGDPWTPVTAQTHPLTTHPLPDNLAYFSPGDRIFPEFPSGDLRLLDSNGQYRTLFSLKALFGDDAVRVQRLDASHLVAVHYGGPKPVQVVKLKLAPSGPPAIVDRWDFQFGPFSFEQLVVPQFDRLWIVSGDSHGSDFNRRLSYLGNSPPHSHYFREARPGKPVELIATMEATLGRILTVDGADAANPAVEFLLHDRLGRFDLAQGFGSYRDVAPLFPPDEVGGHLAALEFARGDFWELPYDDATSGAEVFHWKRKFLAELQRFEAAARRPVPGKLPKQIHLSTLVQMDAVQSDALSPLHQVPKEQLMAVGLDRDYTLRPARTAALDTTVDVNELARLATSCATLLTAPYQPLF